MEYAPLPVVIPLIMAAALAALEQLPNRHRHWLLDSASLATALAVLALDLLLLERSLAATVVYWFGAWPPIRGFPVGIAFVIDPAAAAFALLAAFLTCTGFIYSWHYFRAVGTYYHSLMLLFLASMQGFCLTGDLFNMFVFFELMGVSAYALTGYKIEESGPLEGALNFSVMNSIGGVMVLLGIALVYGGTGGLNLAWIGASLPGNGAAPTLAVAFMLLSVGFLVKGAVIPFHFWLPDAHSVAPTPASILFSGVMVQLGLYAIARIYWVVFVDYLHPELLRDVFMALGAATALLGALMACLQRHLKRLLAFSTVSHSGIMLMGISLWDREALSGTFLYIVGHGLVKSALFVCAGILLYHFESVDEVDLRGKGRPLKLTGLLFCLGGLALAGLPLFGTWTGKGVLEESATRLGYSWVPAVCMLAAAVTGGAVLRAGGAIFFALGTPSRLAESAPVTGSGEGPESESDKGPTPVMMQLPLVLLLLSALAVGTVPKAQEVAARGAALLADDLSYRRAVLRGEVSAAAPRPVHASKPGWEGGAASAAIALVVAGLFLAPAARQVRRLQQWKGALKIPVRLLREVHSGYIGDYLTWFMVGASILVAVSILSV